MMFSCNLDLPHISLKMILPDDDIHDEAVSQQADDKHHGVDRGDDGNDWRHALLLPALIMGHIAALRVSRHPGGEIRWTILHRRGEAVIVFFEYFDWSAFHADTCSFGDLKRMVCVVRQTRVKANYIQGKIAKYEPRSSPTSLRFHL